MGNGKELKSDIIFLSRIYVLCLPNKNTKMKSINNFFDKAPLWKIYIFGWTFSGLFTFAMFEWVAILISGTVLPTTVNLKIGATTGILLGLIFMLMILMARKSDKFWAYSKEVESLIDKAETKEELGSIYKGEFQSLRELAQGGPHLSELTRQYAIMQTKYKYAK